MIFVVFFLAEVLIQILPWLGVEAAPLDQFLAVRSQKCSLLGQSSPEQSGRRGQMPHEPIKGRAGKGTRPKQLGPPIDPEGGYDPSEGYELYWVNGGWVLGKEWKERQFGKKKKSPKVTTTKKPDADNYCGLKCDHMYRLYGVVCGRDKDGKYKTYENYCYLLAQDCAKIKGWQIAYRGKCEPTIEPFYTLARKQHSYHMALVNSFYAKYSRPIGSAVKATQKWTYSHIYDDH